MSPPDKLAGLRGLHLPATLQADAWPLLGAAAVGIALAAGVRVVAGRRRRAKPTDALAELAAIAALPASERRTAQAGLLRRLVKRRVGAAAARAQGEAWLQQLDALFGTDFFALGAGRAFGEALYRPPVPAREDPAPGLRALLARVRR